MAESLKQEIGYLLATIKETKRISANLRPTTLDDLGLTAMRERCEIFGGSFHIESRRGRGTKINAILPI